MEQLQRRRLLECFLVALAFAVYLYPSWPQAWLLTFQTRDILRAQELLRGQPIFFGPEVTGGGYLPGGLYYYLLALPLALGLGWKGTWVLIVALQAATAGLLWRFFRACSGGFLVPAVALAGFAVALPICLSSLLLLNSACVFLPTAVMLAALCHAYAPHSSPLEQRRALAAYFLALACGAQMHLTVLALLPPLVILQLLRGRGGVARVPGKLFLRSLFFLFPLLPWLAWRAARELGVPLGQQPPSFAELKGLGNFVKYSYGNFTLIYWEAHRYYGGFWYAVGQMLGQLHRYVTDAGPLSWIFYGGFLLWAAGAGRPRAPATRILFLCAVFAFVPGLSTMGAGAMGSRYLGVTSLTWIFFSAAVFEQLTRGLRSRPFASALGRRCAGGALAAAACAVVLFFGVRSGRFHSVVAQDPAFREITPAIELERACGRMISLTGWPYSKLRERAFLLNVFNEMTLQTGCEELEGKVAAAPEGAEPDGFFVARRPTPQDETESARDLKAWLLSQEVPANVAEGLKGGGIALGTGTELGSLVVVPYFVKNREKFPPWFQNRSEHYQNTQEARIDEALRDEAAFPARTRVALFNHCPWRSSHCRVALVARSEDLADPGRAVSVEVLGMPLSHPTQHYNPVWTEALLEPYFSYRCSAKEEPRKEVLSPAVGFFIVDRWIMNHTFLAPYRRELRPQCARGSRMVEITMGFRAAASTTHMKETPVPGDEASFRLAK